MAHARQGDPPGELAFMPPIHGLADRLKIGGAARTQAAAVIHQGGDGERAHSGDGGGVDRLEGMSPAAEVLTLDQWIRPARLPQSMRNQSESAAPRLAQRMAGRHLSVVPPTQKPWLRQIVEFGDRGETKPEVVIFGAVEQGPIAANSQQGFAPHHHGRMDQRRADRQRGPYAVPAGWDPYPPAAHAICIDPQCLSAENADFGVSIQIPALGGESVWEGDIVGVHAGDVAPAGECQTEIQCTRDASTIPNDQTHLIITSRKSLQHRGGCITATIIDGDNFEIDPLLCDQAVQRLGKKAPAISYR